MTVTSEQIAKAEAKGLVNVEALAAACDKLKFPFYFACTITERETKGKNIYGHDVGGIFTQRGNLEVTETNYKEFLRLLAEGRRSNGVGPMQLTYKGYHIGPKSLTARGLKAWVPADNMFYGVEILANYVKHNYDLGMSQQKALWQAAKSYNGNTSYADAVMERAKVWLAIVGNADTKPEGDDDMPTAKEVVDELLKPENLKKIAIAVWTAEILKPGADNKDPNDKTWQPHTFLRTTYNRVAELLKK